MSKNIQSVARTDPGRIRTQNEDAFSIDDELNMYIVSDGMGGMQGGEIASAIVVRGLPLEVAARINSEGIHETRQAAEILVAAIDAISSQLLTQSNRVERLRGMGATVVACLIYNDTAIIAHMGDSRAYLLRKNVLEQMTEDHTLVATLLKLKQISKKEARIHPGRHVVSRYVGMETEVGPDVGLIRLKEGDLILLCTDGLTNMIFDKSIGQILYDEPSIESSCDRLIQTANNAVGKDNITAMIIKYGETLCSKKADTKVSVRRTIGHSVERVTLYTE